MYTYSRVFEWLPIYGYLINVNLRSTTVTCNNILLVLFFCATWDGNKVNSDQICNKGGENNNGVRFIGTWIRFVLGVCYYCLTVLNGKTCECMFLFVCLFV